MYYVDGSWYGSYGLFMVKAEPKSGAASAKSMGKPEPKYGAPSSKSMGKPTIKYGAPSSKSMPLEKARGSVAKGLLKEEIKTEISSKPQLAKTSKASSSAGPPLLSPPVEDRKRKREVTPRATKDPYF